MHRFDKQVLRERPAHAFAREQAIRFQDVDAAGVLFYPRLLEHCHDLYVTLLEQAGSPLPQVLAERRWVAPIRHAEADYFRPLRYGDRVEWSVVAAHLEPSEVTLGFRAARIEGGEVAAVAQSVHVFVEPTAFQRIEIPDPPRSLLERLAV